MLSASHALQYMSRFVLKIRRNDDLDRLADRFLGGMAKQSFGREIPTRNAPVQGLGHDRIVRRTYHGSVKLLSIDVGLQQLFVALLPHQFGRVCLLASNRCRMVY